MAKTTSQIVKENKQREKTVNQIVSAIKARDAADSGTAEKNRARTLDVLAKAISKTSDSTPKSDLERAYKSTSGSKPKTAMDMQKKKEERQEAKVSVDSLQLKRDRAQKALDNYEEKTDFDATDTNARKAFDREINSLKNEVNKVDTEIDQRTMQRDLDTIEAMNDEDRAAFEKYVSGSTYVDIEDIEAHKGLKSRYGDRLDLLKESYERNRDAEKVRQVSEETAKKVQDGGWMADAMRTVASVPANIIGGVTGTAARVDELFNRTGQYKNLAPYTLGDIPSVYGQTVQSEKTKEILDGQEMNLLDGISGKEVGAMAYQGATSLLEIAGRIALSFGNPTAAAGLAATQSFSNSMTEATKQGATPEQAVILSVGKAGLEAATEKMPLDDLLDIAKGGMKSGWKVLKQVFTEITEEELSLFGGIAMEAAVLREKSSYKQNIGDLVAGGMSYEEAKEQANKAVWNEALQTAAVSGFSGALSAGGADYVNTRFVGTPVDVTEQAPGIVPAADNSSEMTTEVPQEIPAETAPKAPEVEPVQQAAPSTEPLLEGIRDMTPPPAPLTEELQHFDNAAAIANGMEPVQQTQEESTSVNTDPAQHTLQEQAVIDEYQNAVDDNLAEYIEAVRNNPGQRMPRYPLNNVSDRAAADIQRLTGIDVSGNKTQIEARTVEHILKRHGENGNADHSMRDVNDIARIQYVIDNYDSIEHGGTTGAYRYQNADGKQVHSQTVLIKKKVNGTYFVVEAVPDTKKKTLYILSAYMNKNGQKETATSLVGDAEAYRVTSETKTKSDAVLNNSIAENGTEVNGNIDESSARDVDIQNQSAEGGQVKGTGAAEWNFSGKAAYQDLLHEGNVQPDRPGDVRPMEVPKTDGNGKRVTEFAANAYGAGVTTDEMASTIESLIQDGELGFDVRTNRESLNNAAEAIQKRGAAATRKQLTNRIDRKKIQDGDIEQGILLYAKYAEKGENDNASEMLVDLAQMANITGRNLQMFKLLRRMTVEGQVMTLQKEIRRSAENMIRSGQVKKGYEPSFDPQRMEDYRKALEELRVAKTPESQETAKQKVKEIQDTIYAAEAAKMPATFKAKWDAWRYMSMLGNVKTQVRNIAGNLMFKPYKEVKDTAAALFEKALPKDQRTKALMQDPQLLKWAKSDAGSEDVQNALKYSAKLGDDVASQKIAERTKVFDTKALEAMRKLVEKAPQAGDMLFKNDYYARSLAGFLKARGYSAQQIQNGEVSADVMIEARTYAIDEAMKATFNDCNQFSDAIASIGRGGEDNPWKKALNIAAEGILPFRRTPANIVVRFTEYSPAGLAKGMWNMAAHVKNGDMSAAAAIDQITAGLTGTGIMTLGYMMAAGMNGIKLTGSSAEEDEKRQGHQDYALEFSIDGKEYSYRIDWAAPANLPLFVGANIYNAIQNAGGDPDVSKITSIIRGMGTAFEPMLALSCMSSLNDLVEGVRYAGEGEALYSIATDIATSYFTQGIPALARQTYQATQETKQTTFANDPDPTIRDLQKTAANVPFVAAEFQTDKVNAWGEKEDQGDWMSRTFNAFANPGSLKKIDNSPLEQEINRLNDAQTENVTPPTASKILSYTDKQGKVHKDIRLTEEQYQTLAQTQGQTAKTILDSMISSKDYAALTDEQKAKAIQQAYSYARETAEIKAIGEDVHTGYGEAWMMELEEGKEAAYILRRVASSELSGAMSALDTAWDKGYDDTGRSNDLQWAYDTFASLTPKAKEEVREWATGTTAKYIEARENGIGHDQFVSAAENIAKVQGTGSNGSVRDIDRREAIAKTAGLSAQQIDTIMKCYMEDYDPENGKTGTTELKYDYIRHGMGLSAAEYAETYRASLDNSKKADKIAAIMALGYDKKTATALYNVYSSNSKGKAAYMGYHNSH